MQYRYQDGPKQCHGSWTAIRSTRWATRSRSSGGSLPRSWRPRTTTSCAIPDAEAGARRQAVGTLAGGERGQGSFFVQAEAAPGLSGPRITALRGAALHAVGVSAFDSVGDGSTDHAAEVDDRLAVQDQLLLALLQSSSFQTRPRFQAVPLQCGARRTHSLPCSMVAQYTAPVLRIPRPVVRPSGQVEAPLKARSPHRREAGRARQESFLTQAA